MAIFEKIKIPLLFVVIYATVFWVFYGTLIGSWNQQIPGSGEDGAKNYYTLSYHIAHDSTAFHFGGMNYPYGEHVVFTDNQPLISELFRQINAHPNWAWIFILVSAFIGGWFIFLMANRNGVNRWISMVGSLGIMLLSPQLLRLGGHYSLAYMSMIPMVLYIAPKKELIWQVVQIAIISLSGFIHPYFLMMLTLYWGVYMLIELWLYRTYTNVRAWLKTLIFPLLPLLIFQLVMFATDSVADRPEAPFGFIHYRATWASVFLPLDLKYFQPISGLFTQSMEGGFFIGWFAIAGIILGIVNWFNTKKAAPFDVVFWASIPLLLLALAFPFYIWKLDRLVDYLGPLRQFRGIARFAFVFFYASNIFALISISKFLKEKSRIWQIGTATLLCVVFGLDIWNFQNQIFSKTTHGTDAFHSNAVKELANSVSIEDYQSVIPLPYFHIGSENFRTKEVADIKEVSFALSLQTGIPLHAVQMSRTSLSQTLHQLQLVNFLAGHPKILDDFPNSKPILLLVKTHADLTTSQMKLISAARRVHSSGDFSLFSLPLEAFDKIASENKQSIENHTQSQTEHALYFDSFDTEATDQKFSGAGAKKVYRLDWTDLINPDFQYQNEQTYELSFWFYAGTQQATNTQVWFWERDENGQDHRFEVTEVGDHITQIIGDWILCTMEFRVASPKNKIQVMLHRDGRNLDIWFDEVLLRKSSQDFSVNKMSLNNRYIEPTR